MERQDFMSFFRDDEKLNTLSTDDRIEIFSGILSGSSDITIELLQELLQDYCVDNIVVYDRKQLFDRFPILNTEPIIATTTTTQTEEETPQQLEVGKWYTYKEDNCDWLMNYQGEGDVCYGFNTYGLWDNDYIMSLASSALNWKPATQEEVQTALIKEARKRGYTANNFKTLKEGTSGFDTDFNFTYFDDILFCKPLGGGGAVVYENGVWAEVIEEEKEEETQPVKLIPNRWYTLKENADSILIFVKDSEDASNNYGFLRDGSWFENFDGVWDYTTRPQEWREATQQEVEEILIKEARDRGYKGGQLIKSFIYGKSRLSDEGEGFRFDTYMNRLWYNDNIIFQGGVWAEVIND